MMEGVIPRSDDWTEWAYARVNNQLAAIYFIVDDGGFRIYGHCIVEGEEFDQREQRWIVADTAKYQFVYKDDRYTRASK